MLLRVGEPIGLLNFLLLGVDPSLELPDMFDQLQRVAPMLSEASRRLH